MRRKGPDPRVPLRVHRRLIPAGYTYFGQFIDHDLTLDRSDLPLPGDVVTPSSLPNLRRSFLNLDSLYGDGPDSSASGNLYEEDGYFKLGAALSNGHSFDVPLDRRGAPLAADSRNLENAIVRQIHAIFLQLHNKAMDRLRDFTAAKDLVRHQFQYLVLNDFLPRVCNDAVLSFVKEHPNSLFDWSGGFAVPVEFSIAAFRFGHSMVRSEYILGRDSNVMRLEDLLGGRGVGGPLSTDVAVNWPSFLERRDLEFQQLARPISATVVDSLFSLRPESIDVFTANDAPGSTAPFYDRTEGRLPLRNLMRGAACNLCAGQAASQLACPDSSLEQLFRNENNSSWSPLRACGLAAQSPLWYYVLFEAQLQESGVRLGTLGSIIVAGTIEGALWSNPASYVHKPTAADPPMSFRDSEGRVVTLLTLFDVAKFVGLA